MMTIELECGSCGRRMHVDSGEGIVICPHCRTALQIPGPAQPNAPQTDDGDATTMPVVTAAESATPDGCVAAHPSRAATPDGCVAAHPSRAATDVESESASQFAFLELTDHGVPAVPDSSVFPGFPVGVDGPASDATPVFTESEPQQQANWPLSEFAVAGVRAGANTSIQPDSQGAPAGVADATGFAEVESAEFSANPAGTSAAAFEEPGNIETAVAQPPQGVPRFLFVMLAGYACAVTIALIWLWWTRGRVHPLESLPDLEPVKQTYLVPEELPLPPGHTLRLGETRRFGNLEITPLGVTRGPALLVSLTTLNREDSVHAESTFPLLKLRLRLRNVSRDQTFRPFGRELLRLPGSSRHDRFNTFVCRTDQKREDGERVLVYHLTREQRDLVLQGQDVDRELAPQESCETFIATTDQGLDELTGDLVWRVHVRKGLNPRTGRGVTTLVEVAFHSDSVQDEPPQDADSGP